MKTVAELRREFRAQATDRRLDPRDVDLLLSDCLHRPQSWLLAHGDEPLNADAAECFTERIARRFAGEPIQYILGRTEFYGRDFAVDSRVLIPRPETELLVESVLLRAPSGGRIVDIGTGTGCIAITLKLERAELSIVATDLSPEALVMARTNARALGASIALVRTDLLAGIRTRFDVIVSNPPYIPASELPSLQTEVRDHEPHLAIASGSEGLDAIRRLLASGREFLVKGGLLAMEIGFGQANEVARLAGRSGWSEVGIFKDLAGIERVVIVTPED